MKGHESPNLAQPNRADEDKLRTPLTGRHSQEAFLWDLALSLKGHPLVQAQSKKSAFPCSRDAPEHWSPEPSEPIHSKSHNNNNLTTLHCRLQTLWRMERSPPKRVKTTRQTLGPDIGGNPLNFFPRPSLELSFSWRSA